MVTESERPHPPNVCARRHASLAVGAAVVLALSLTVACGSPSYLDGAYACTPGEPSTCPDGFECLWSPTGGEHRCFRVDGSECGNGVQESDEHCDGEDLSGESCDTLLLGGGTLRCKESCSFDTTQCNLESACGNGIIENGEECEGQNLQGQTCTTLGFTGGDLACSDEGCGFDTSACTTSGCQDDDGDGYGPGCAAGEDCDDTAPGIVGPCATNGCPEGWRLVEAGDFPMGCNALELDATCRADEQPRHVVTLTAFCIESTEVSVAAFRACDIAGHCIAVPRSSSEDEWCNWSPTGGSREQHPLNCIERTDARQYCADYLGGDLPTEAQWEKAARGTDQRKYPWGNLPEPGCSLSNLDSDGAGAGLGCSAAQSGPGTWEVGSVSTGAGDSPYGLQDMAGNVGEWVLDFYKETFYSLCSTGCSDPVNTDQSTGQVVVRGGSFSHADGVDLRTVNRQVVERSTSGSDIGFRCVRPL